MDFAFIPEPGKDASILAARQLYHSRIPPSGIVPEAKANLEDILKWIDTHVLSGQQVSSVFLVSHASDHDVSLLMTPGQKGRSVYMLLVDLQQGSIALIVASSARHSDQSKELRIGRRPVKFGSDNGKLSRVIALV